MIYVWLVEEFSPDGSSTGRYMLDRGSLAITYDVYAARRLRREMSAAFSALDMEEKHGGDWRPVEHGFLHSPEPAPQAEPAPLSVEQCHRICAQVDAQQEATAGDYAVDFVRAVERAQGVAQPAPQAEPAAVGEPPLLTVARLNELARKAQVAFCLDEFPSFELAFARGARAVEREVRAAIASAPHAREPLNFDRLQSVMAAHFGGRELTDDEADSAEAFARAIERAHGIGA